MGVAAPPPPPPPPTLLSSIAPAGGLGGLGALLSSVVLKTTESGSKQQSAAQGQDLLTQIREGKKLRKVQEPMETRRNTSSATDKSVAAILMRRFALEASDSEESESEGEAEEWSD